MKLSSCSEFAEHFAQTYVAAAPRVIYRMTLSCLPIPKALRIFSMAAWIGAIKFSADAILAAPTRRLLPGEGVKC